MPMSTSHPNPRQPAAESRILAFGAHPDDLEFGAGGILLAAAASGATIHIVLGSRGESGTNGTASERESEACAAANQLGAALRWVELGGDAHMVATVPRALDFARVVREVRPDIVFAPTTEPEQHPDHAVVGTLARDALRLARYGKVHELHDLEPCSVSRFYQYAIGQSAEPRDAARLVVDVSDQEAAWIELMNCHASQMKTRRYVDLQLARARTFGLQSGVELAQVLYTVEPLVFSAVKDLPATARLF